MAVTKAQFAALATKFRDDTFNDFTVSFKFKKILMLDDGQGGQTRNETTFSTVDGFAEDATSSEKENQGRLESSKLIKFSCKYLSGIDEKMKIQYLTNDYDILQINNLNQADVWLEIIAEKKWQ